MAQAHFEQALRISDSNAIARPSSRFGHDTGVAATVYLALAHWLLGEEPAREADRSGDRPRDQICSWASGPWPAVAYWFNA